MRAHLFNPENEMALVSNRASYTPPAAIQRFKRALQELPRWWADDGDIIITSETKSIPVEAEPCPWGWSRSAVTTFRNLGCRGPFPDVELIRQLSHRRTACKLTWAVEVTDPRQIERTDVFLKAPWSCSGRGVTDCSGMTVDGVRALAAKVIRSQGSVMVEPKRPNDRDFALLFEAQAGHIQFKGISYFFTGKILNSHVGTHGSCVLSETDLKTIGRSSRASLQSATTTSYGGNFCAPQEELAALIPAGCIPQIRNQLKAIVPTEYSGPIGVDMIGDGAEFHAVEINWRRTMGFVAMALYERLGRGVFSIQAGEHEGVQLVPSNPYFSATFIPQP